LRSKNLGVAGLQTKPGGEVPPPAPGATFEEKAGGDGGVPLPPESTATLQPHPQKGVGMAV